ncbi:MAG: FAD:protein FMN transferase [Woeseiaceae bacterium]
MHNLTSILQACYSTQSNPPWRSAVYAVLLLIVATITACSDAERVADSRLDFFALGTEVSVTLYGVTDERATVAKKRLESELADMGHDWYPWRPGELSRINAAIADGQSIDVTKNLARIIQRAAEVEVLSNNAFNAGLGQLTELWGLHDFSAPPGLPGEIDIRALLDSGMSVAAINWDDNRMSGAARSTMIDLGGIAKGAVLDEIVFVLDVLDIDNAIINIGGDLRVVGDVHGRPARIGIRSPIADSPVASIDIAAGETVVTSGNYERFVEIDGRRYAHVLDPRTGYPVEHTASVTVIHNDAMLADAAATALMVGGPTEFDALAKALGLEFALLIDASGDLRLTPAMGERLNWIEQGPHEQDSRD